MGDEPRRSWYLLDTGYACGAVIVNEAGVIVGGAPIFRKLYGLAVAALPARYKRQRLAPEYAKHEGH